MSVRFTSASTQNCVLNQALDYNADYSALVWVKFATLAANQQIMNVAGATAGSDYDTMMYISATNNLACRVSIATVNDDVRTGSAPVVDTWYCLAMVRRSVTQLDFYWGTTPAGLTLVGQVPATSDVTARAASASMRWGTVGGTTNPLNASIYGSKWWSKELSLSELQSEAAYAMPVDSGSIYDVRPFEAPFQLQDYSRNRTLLPVVTNGPLTEGTDNPSISWSPGAFARTAIPTFGGVLL